MKKNLRGFTLKELEEFAISIGEQKYRGKQLFNWLYTREAGSFGEMTSLSNALREKLSSVATIDSLKPIEIQESRRDGTTKFLFQLGDGKRVECVLIPPRTAFDSPDARSEEEQQRLTLCVSTQVGCPLDCKFCATATMGFLRNLTAGEIVGQVLEAKKISGKSITNLVYMGMGEPLLNYEEVMKSVEIITNGMNIAPRRITVSTAGLTPEIHQMADEKRKVKLAVSLHTLDDAARASLMPIGKKYSLDDLLNSTEYYYRKTRRRVTFEYILFDGWNDRDEDVARLVKLAKRIPCKVNIIPFHSIEFTHPTGLSAKLLPTPPARADEFVRKLREAHLTVFVRSSAGEDIDAACGQLAVKVRRMQEDRRTVSGHKPPAHNILRKESFGKSL